MLHVTDFHHYLYTAAPSGFQPQDCEPFKAHLETLLAQHQQTVHSVQLTMRQNMYGFQGNMDAAYIKITVTDPKHINRLRTTIESNQVNYKGMFKFVEGGVMTFDIIQYVLRFMIDCKVGTVLGILYG